jgi:hypothetical protein
LKANLGKPSSGRAAIPDSVQDRHGVPWPVLALWENGVNEKLKIKCDFEINVKKSEGKC